MFWTLHNAPKQQLGVLTNFYKCIFHRLMQVLAFSLVQSCGFWPKYKLRPIWSKFVARSEVLFLSSANERHSALNIER